MSGHSKWSTIKRDKAINDSKRSQIFSKISRAITVSAKLGGGDPDANPTLRLAIEKAREARMPKDNIDKAVNKGVGKLEAGEKLEEITYEGYGPGGVAFMVTTITDNRNRTVSELRTIFSRAGGSLGSAGSTAYIFGSDPEEPSYFVEVTDKALEERLIKLSEDIDDHDDVQDVYSNFKIME